MTGYKIVLIAIDLEGEPKQVLAKAQLLVDPSADIAIFNAAFDPSYIYACYAETGGLLKETSVTIKDKARIKALQQLNQLVKKTNLQTAHCIVEFGRAADQIIEQAKKLQAELIIISSHGRHGVSLLLGSTANAVLHHAECDVLAVKIKNDKKIRMNNPQPTANS